MPSAITFICGGRFVLWVGLLLNTGADAGWFRYVPLSGPQYSPGNASIFWSQMITFTEVSALASPYASRPQSCGYRAPGMTLNRMPILLWEKLVISIRGHFRHARGDGRKRFTACSID